MTKGKMIDAIYKANLTKRATLVVFYLINRANKEMTCFPGVKTIAKECNISTRTVQRALNDLVEAGFLKKESRFHEQGGQRSNLYTLKIAEEENDNFVNDTVTFEDYINDMSDCEKENKVDEKGNGEDGISPIKHVRDKKEISGRCKFDEDINNVDKKCSIRLKNYSIDFCRGG